MIKCKGSNMSRDYSLPAQDRCRCFGGQHKCYSFTEQEVWLSFHWSGRCESFPAQDRFWCFAGQLRCHPFTAEDICCSSLVRTGVGHLSVLRGVKPFAGHDRCHLFTGQDKRQESSFLGQDKDELMFSRGE